MHFGQQRDGSSTFFLGENYLKVFVDLPPENTPHICHRHRRWCLWRKKNCHLEKFQIIHEIVPFKSGDKSVKWKMNNVLSHFLLSCCKISLLCDLRCFAAKSLLLRFTLWRGEKLSQKLCPWRKNDKYEVWSSLDVS